MFLLRMVCVSLICLTAFSTPSIPFNFPFPLVRPSYGTMLQIAHITVTGILGYLLLRTNHQLKNVNNKISTKLQKTYVTQSTFEGEINKGIEIKVQEKASQTGMFWATKGELVAVQLQLADRATKQEHTALEDRVDFLEKENKRLTAQLKALQTNKN